MYMVPSNCKITDTWQEVGIFKNVAAGSFCIVMVLSTQFVDIFTPIAIGKDTFINGEPKGEMGSPLQFKRLVFKKRP